MNKKINKLIFSSLVKFLHSSNFINNRKALASSSFILGTILVFFLALYGHIIVEQPEDKLDKFAVMENEKSIEQIKSERQAALEFEAAISVLGYEAILNANDATIKTVLFNPGGTDALNPSIENIVIKDEKSYIPLGKPIDSVFNIHKIIKGQSETFLINIVEPELIANLVNRTFVRVDIAFNYTDFKTNFFKKEIQSMLLKVD